MNYVALATLMAGVALLAFAGYLSYTIGYFGTTYQNGVTPIAIGVLVMAMAIQVIFARKKND